MIVLGLDLSYTATGWVALQASEEFAEVPPIVTANDVIRTPAIPAQQRAEVFLRCGRVFRIVEAVLAVVHERRPSVIGIEDYSYESVEGAHLTGELHGVLLHYLWRTEQVVDRVPIGTWRRLALGNGQLAKDQIRTEVLKRYGVEFKSLDVVEAYGVAVATWMRRIGADKPVSKRRRQRLLAEVPQLSFDPFL